MRSHRCLAAAYRAPPGRNAVARTARRLLNQDVEERRCCGKSDGARYPFTTSVDAIASVETRTGAARRRAANQVSAAVTRVGIRNTANTTAQRTTRSVTVRPPVKNPAPV